MTTRVVVTGATGQVARDLVDCLAGRVPPGGDDTYAPDGQPVREGEFEIVALDRGRCDVSDRTEVHQLLFATRPDVVVNLAAYTAVDRAESDENICAAVNVKGVSNLVELCADLSAHLITLSTDYVFDGEKGEAYVEDDPTNPLNVYGATKRAGELACRDVDTVVRTSWVIGVRGNSVAHVIANRAAEGLAMTFVDDQRGSPTFAADLARCLVTMVRERPVGTWHLAGTGDVTWFELARAIADASGRGELVQPIRSADLTPHPAARRPRRSDLSTLKWQGRGHGALPTWQHGLNRFLRDR
jgi:dTDP-4-dehydrorhamnose reductase